MKAITFHNYGSVDVMNIEEVADPTPESGELLISVRAASVTTADWRIRSLAMPGIMKLLGRLMFGVFGPRNKVLGADVAGIVSAVGDGVTKFQVGDVVFGHVGKGGHAEYAVTPQHGAILLKPLNLSFAEAASLPFGGLSALVFLRDQANLTLGDRILIVGASGNVGVHAVQIAKAMGAHVSGMASASNKDFVLSLGAEGFVDYQTADPTELEERFDVVFDTYGALTFRKAKKLLKDKGLFLPLNFTLGQMLANVLFGWAIQKKMITSVSGNIQDDLIELVGLLEDGKLRPVIDKEFRFTDIAEAYTRIEGRRRRGGTVLNVGDGSSR